MKVFIQIGHGVIGAAVISGLCIYQAGSFGEARHTISIIGAIAIVIASLYLLRSRWIRWGNRQTWLKYHQRLASMGLCLVLYHSAFQPLAWHSWLTLLLALSNLGTGITVSLTARKTRQMLLRCYLILAPILLVSIVLHGQQKLEHDEFFPLTDVHDVPCARCHTPERLLFHVSTTNWISLSSRSLLSRQENITGSNPDLNIGMSPSHRSDFRGHTRLDFAVSCNLTVPTGTFAGQRFAIEMQMPLYQNLNGIQLKSK